ncbi:MAG TPA: MBL fold metallo-hydrolase [Usitatibacter sp.]|nr:MBL fold metallo-hydrolase [Usitatibacter sp.]
MITNTQSGTNLHEIAPRIYRINTPVDLPGGMSFNFNQYLVTADQPLVFHTGPRKMFPLVAEAIRRVMPLERLRYIGFSHFEADECGSLDDFLAAAPHAEPLTGAIAKMVSVDDYAERPARALADGESLDLGSHVVRWFDTPHVPHGWECGFLMERTTGTLLCGDLFTQGGRGDTPLTTGDILGPSEAMRSQMDYYAHAPTTRASLERLAAERPKVLACMHGSAWQGDGAALLRELADVVTGSMVAARG